MRRPKGWHTCISFAERAQAWRRLARMMAEDWNTFPGAQGMGMVAACHTHARFYEGMVTEYLATLGNGPTYRELRALVQALGCA